MFISFVLRYASGAVFINALDHMPQLDAFGVLLVVIGVLVGTFWRMVFTCRALKDAGSQVLLGTIEPVMTNSTTALVLGTTLAL